MFNAQHLVSQIQKPQDLQAKEKRLFNENMSTYTCESSLIFELPATTWNQLSCGTLHHNKPGGIVMAFRKTQDGKDDCSVTHQIMPAIFSWQGQRNQTWSVPTRGDCRVLVCPADGQMYVHEVPFNRVQTAQSFVARALLEQLFAKGRKHQDTDLFRQCVEIMEHMVDRPMRYLREVEKKGDCLSFELSDQEFWWLHSNGTVYLELNVNTKYEIFVPFSFSDARVRVANLYTRKKCEAKMVFHNQPRQRLPPDHRARPLHMGQHFSVKEVAETLCKMKQSKN